LNSVGTGPLFDVFALCCFLPQEGIRLEEFHSLAPGRRLTVGVFPAPLVFWVLEEGQS